MTRRAFTLVELLVAMSIIAILAGLSIGTFNSARQTAREARTKATITKLHNIVMERYESYRTRRLTMDPQQVAPGLGLDPDNNRDLARLRLYALRDLMRMEMPERRQDILSLSSTGVAEPSIHQALRGWMVLMETRSAWREYEHVEAEIFYAWLTIADPEVRERFAENEVADTDGDSALEFVDGWGQPIYFLRWPVAFDDSDIQVADPVANHDPLDVRNVQPEAFRTFPLIYSPGRDGVYDVNVKPGIDYGASWIVNPYIHDVGRPIGNGGHWDNVHNHRLIP